MLAMFPGMDTIKIKVAEKGQTIEQDLDRITTVRILKPEAKLRLDANGGYTVAEALLVAEEVGELDYFEQPCATIADCSVSSAHSCGSTPGATDCANAMASDANSRLVTDKADLGRTIRQARPDPGAQFDVVPQGHAAAVVLLERHAQGP